MSIFAIVTPAASKDLLDLDEVKEDLGVTDSAQDSKLARAIRRASALIVSITGREFIRETVKERVRGASRPLLLVSRRPIVSIARIAPVEADGTLGTDLLAADYYIHDADGGAIAADTGWEGSRFHLAGRAIGTFTAKGTENWEVEYVGGYEEIATDPPVLPLVPEEVAEAAMVLVRGLWHRKGRDPSIASERIGDHSIAYTNPGTTSVAHLREAQDVLEMGGYMETHFG